MAQALQSVPGKDFAAMPFCHLTRSKFSFPSHSWALVFLECLSGICFTRPPAMKGQDNSFKLFVI
jgi:hypothetical protein